MNDQGDFMLPVRSLLCNFNEYTLFHVFTFQKRTVMLLKKGLKSGGFQSAQRSVEMLPADREKRSF